MPAVPTAARGAVITGWGAALPDKVVTNDDLQASGLDTNDQWIIERTGIRERRVGGSTASLSIEAGRQAIERSGLALEQIDGLVLATTTPDRTVPATSTTVQAALGLRCGAFDVNAACSGFTYALVVAHGMIAIGAQKILVIGTDTLSRIVDWTDRNTAVLFADGSGAVVLEATEGRGQLRGWDLDADGTAEDLLYAEVGGLIKMDGKEVFRRAVRIMVDSAEKSMKQAGVRAEDIALVVPHQANTRIIKAACDRLGIGMDRALGGARPHRQHVGGVDPPRPGRRPRQRPRRRRRPGPARRLRRRDDGRQHGHRVGRRGVTAAPPGKITLVTGGSRGIGLACARRLAADGHRVAVTYRSSEPPDGLFGVACDVTSTPDVEAAFAAVTEHFGGPVEVLVSNAGVTRDGLLLRMSDDDFTAVVDANLTAAFRVSKRAAREMLRARAGRIILVSSVVALLGSAGQANYAASKAGLVGFARSLARELGSRGITVNVVAPGPVATDMTAVLGDKRLAELTAAVPLGRMAAPEEIAAAVAFLASDDAGYITGAVLPVDGGLGMGH